MRRIQLEGIRKDTGDVAVKTPLDPELEDAGGKTCCAPVRTEGTKKPNPQPVSRLSLTPTSFDTATIPGGKAWLGTDAPVIPGDGEGPLRAKTVKPFRLMKTAVSNEQFEKFVEQTGYVTEAEQFGWSFVFYSDVPKSIPETQAVAGTEWWRKVEGATWRAIHGPGTEDAWHPDHPVVQVSWNDALAFAGWCGGRLPIEAEWEHAARGGFADVRYPWGDEEPDDTEFMPCNIWQGQFPQSNTVADGWPGTAPVDAFTPNSYGLYNMAGNVWEWTADPYRVKSLKKQIKQKLEAMKGFKLLKGGSFLCHRSYCHRYRIAARTGNSPDTTTPHQGFRIAWDAR